MSQIAKDQVVHDLALAYAVRRFQNKTLDEKQPTKDLDWFLHEYASAIPFIERDLHEIIEDDKPR